MLQEEQAGGGGGYAPRGVARYGVFVSHMHDLSCYTRIAGTTTFMRKSRSSHSLAASLCRTACAFAFAKLVAFEAELDFVNPLEILKGLAFCLEPSLEVC